MFLFVAMGTKINRHPKIVCIFVLVSKPFWGNRLTHVLSRETIKYLRVHQLWIHSSKRTIALSG